MTGARERTQDRVGLRRIAQERERRRVEGLRHVLDAAHRASHSANKSAVAESHKL